MIMELAFTPIVIKVLCDIEDESNLSLQSVGVIIGKFFRRLDVLLTYSIVRGVQSAMSPLSLLSYISHLKAKESPADSKISFEFRTTKIDSPDVSNEGILSYPWIRFVVVVWYKLFQRYTIVYSFGKLLAATMLSLVLNEGWKNCSRSGDLTAAECPLGEHVVCLTEVYYTTSCGTNCYYTTPQPSHNYACSDGVSNQCFCGNWMSIQMATILINFAHFFVQCYFYVVYEDFDPQLSQIKCVQSYSFTGNNFLVFLHRPAICMLSLLEAGVLITSYVGALAHPGLQNSGSAHSNAIYFAAFSTFLEVYKANIALAMEYKDSTMENKYAWCIVALLRVDLFVFYGFTLLFQTLLFPMALFNHCREVIGKCIYHYLCCCCSKADNKDKHYDAVPSNNVELTQIA